jgi:hypothetical protein
MVTSRLNSRNGTLLHFQAYLDSDMQNAQNHPDTGNLSRRLTLVPDKSHAGADRAEYQRTKTQPALKPHLTQHVL